MRDAIESILVVIGCLLLLAAFMGILVIPIVIILWAVKHLFF